MKKPFYKKIWFWLIIIIVLGGAGAAGTNKKDKDDIVSVERPSKTELGTETQKSSSASEAATQKNNEPTINEMTLFDADGVKCIAKGIINDKIWGYGIDVEIENTTDKNIIKHIHFLNIIIIFWNRREYRLKRLLRIRR